MTKVIFRKWKNKEGGIIALFPEEKFDAGGCYCMSYMHVGQHGGSDYPYMISITKPAKPEEYQDLLQELISIGYDDLKIQKRRTAFRYSRRRM